MVYHGKVQRMIDFVFMMLLLILNKNYSTNYVENSRETFRKQAMYHFRNAAL